MNKFLKENLPKSYKKSKITRGAYDSISNGIIKTVELRKSDFLDDKDKWVITGMISAYDEFGLLFNTQNCALIIAECSVRDGQIVLLQKWNQLTHWELDDYEGIKKALDEIVLPWLEWFCTPQVLIDYLKELEILDVSSNSSEAVAKYGSVLADRLEFSPPRTRKYFNGVIATFYNLLGNKEAAILHLEKHKKFTINDHRPSTIDEFNKSFKLRMKIIDDGLRELRESNTTENN